MQHTRGTDLAIKSYQWLVNTERIADGDKLTEDLIQRYEGMFVQGAIDYALGYDGDNEFVLDIKSLLGRGRSLSLAQVRGTVNCLLADARVEAREQAREQEEATRPITKAQIIDIHVLVKTLGWDDAEYRDVLNERYGVTTCKALSEAQASEFLESIAEAARAITDGGREPRVLTVEEATRMFDAIEEMRIGR